MRRSLLGVALATGVLFALLAAWAWLNPVTAWEADLLLGLALRDDGYGGLISALNVLGDLLVWGPLVLAMAAVALILRHVYAAVLLALTLAADLLAAFVKVIVERARPEGALVEHLLGQESFAFPSGHVVRMTALVAVLLWLVVPPAWRLATALAGGLMAGIVMGYARVALGVHWPSDAAGGVLLGLAWFAGTAALVGPPKRTAPIGSNVPPD